MTGQRVLITGGAGFIGGHLCRALAARGDRVTALDDLSTGRAANLRGAPVNFVRGDVRDEALVDSLVAEADLVLHLASVVGVRLVVERPVHAIESTVGGAATVLRAAANHGVRFLITSSSEVYGKRDGGPFLETDDIRLGAPTRPRWAYACAKALDEWLTMAWHREAGLPVVIARLFNTVGPGQVGDYGMVLPRFVAAARSGAPLLVHGDGGQSRTFTHVSDTVEALVRLACDRTIVGEVVNVGGTEEITMLELAQRVVQAVGSRSEIRCVPYAEAFDPDFEDMRRRVPSIERLAVLTGFAPRYGLDSIIESVLRDPVP